MAVDSRPTLRQRRLRWPNPCIVMSGARGPIVSGERGRTTQFQDIKRVLEEVLGTPYRVPKQQWAEWAPAVRSPQQAPQIPFEATALRYGLHVSSLKRHGVPLSLTVP